MTESRFGGHSPIVCLASPPTRHWLGPSDSASWIVSPRKGMDCFFGGPRREFDFPENRIAAENELNEWRVRKEEAGELTSRCGKRMLLWLDITVLACDPDARAAFCVAVGGRLPAAARFCHRWASTGRNDKGWNERGSDARACLVVCLQIAGGDSSVPIRATARICRRATASGRGAFAVLFPASPAVTATAAATAVRTPSS